MKRCCDWTRKAGLFLLAGSQLQADQVKQAGAADFDCFVSPASIMLYMSVNVSAYLCNVSLQK